MPNEAYHGGAFFDAIGNDFSTLDNSRKVVSADVLDAWFDPTPNAIEKVREYLSFALKTSPPARGEGLIQTISEQRGIATENIAAHGGSSALMFSFFPHFLSTGGRVLILDPMYGEYAHIFQHVIDVQLFRHRLEKEHDFQVHYNLLARDIEVCSPEVVVLVNPNSPTGQYFEKGSIIRLAKLHESTLFVIDETYIEYVSPDESIEKEVATIPNLIIIKSMSKVYALSGARVAYMVASVSTIERLLRFIPPWAVSLIAQIAGVEALKDKEYYSEKYAETAMLRTAMVQNLETSSIRIFPSVANFILINLFKPGLSASGVVGELRKQNIHIRNCDSMSTQFKDDFIRITVKDAETNAIISRALKTLL